MCTIATRLLGLVRQPVAGPPRLSRVLCYAEIDKMPESSRRMCIADDGQFQFLSFSFYFFTHVFPLPVSDTEASSHHL